MDGAGSDRTQIGSGYQNPSGYFGSTSRQSAYGTGISLPGGGSGAWADTYDSANYAVQYVIGSRKVLVFSVEFLPRVAVITWAKALHDTHLDHECIVTTHSFIGECGTFMHFSGEAAQVGDDNDIGNYGLNPALTTSNSSFQSGLSAWNNYLNTWSNLTLVLCGHSLFQTWHDGQPWLFQQKPLTSSSTREQTVQAIFGNWQEADAGNYPSVPGGGGNVGPGTFCSVVPQGAGGARIAHVIT